MNVKATDTWNMCRTYDPLLLLNSLGWHLVAKTCSSWHLTRRVFNNLHFIAIYLVHYIAQYIECKKMHGMNNKELFFPLSSGSLHFTAILNKSDAFDTPDIYCCTLMIKQSYILFYVGPVAQSVQRLTTGWTVRDQIPVGTRFSARPDRPWGPHSLL